MTSLFNSQPDFVAWTVTFFRLSQTVQNLMEISGKNLAALYHVNVKKLFNLNSSVMDDNHDTYKTANIKINQPFLHA
jgi:hypothetical protein